MTFSILAFNTQSLYHWWMGALLVFGFGFVIFWHELGHFLAAKAVGIKVEQFAVGFGTAIFAWRKGVGLRWGNTQQEYYQRIENHIAQQEKARLQLREKDAAYSDRQMSDAARELGLGDTEYRLNWIPLGGYVKMLGQDDLRPDAAADDPRAYNRKSVSARMLVISAGVIMNVILAALMFVGIFMMGLRAQPAEVGAVVPLSPAQMAGLKVGDKIVRFNGHEEQDFTKIKLDTALSKPDVAVPITVARNVDGVEKTLTLQITPQRVSAGDGFVALGFEPPYSLKAIDPKELDEPIDFQKLAKGDSPDALLVRPGDQIVAIDGKPVTKDDFVALNRAAQEFGKPVDLTIKTAAGATRSGSVQPHFADFFSGNWNLAGMEPRSGLIGIEVNSTAYDKLFAGDAIAKLVIHAPSGDQTILNPDREKFTTTLKKAGSDGNSFSITVVRGPDNKVITVDGLKATADVGTERGQKGLGVLPGFDEAHAVLGAVAKGSPAETAGLSSGDAITAINGQPVKTWYDMHRILGEAQAGSPMDLTYTRDGQEHKATLKLDADQIAQVRDVRYALNISWLVPKEIVRKAPNALVAVKWGVFETRDFILQFYLTLQRMFGGSIGLSNMMGPVGIFRTGVTFSSRGYDWLLWFLAMISANLAVVNFLPIPVVDGGQFTFLIVEKIKGKPVSPRTMVIAQYAGLAFLAAIVVFVTYHDLMRRY